MSEAQTGVAVVGRALRGRAPRVLLAAGLATGLAGAARASNDNLTILQWFETSWTNIENRAPDVFMSGYNGMWVPNPGQSSNASAGFDPFDRFNLGTPGAPTAFGTEASFRAMVRELNRANVAVFPESIMNHNGARTSDANFIADGGWPGIYVPGNGPSANPPGLPYNNTPGAGPFTICGDYSTRAGSNYFWGDFHNGSLQSQDPGSSGYCLWLGDLLSLIDFAQESNYRFIRQPVGANASNIPPGRVRNLPDAGNARFYPDTSLPGMTFTNPAVPGFSNARTVTKYPYNTANPLAGDAAVENVAEYLSRWNQWMIEDVGVDGFRLDAAKHIKHDFWNEYFDTAINLSWAPLGTSNKRTPFTFGESVDSNASIRYYTRKLTVTDGSGNITFQANRDALDLNEAGSLRDILNNPIGKNWQNNVLNSSVDLADNNQQDGSIGVHHLYSHDNGSVGDGGSPPGFPAVSAAGLPQNAYLLLRTGVPVVYYYGREMVSRYATQTGPNTFSATTGRFWPREGNPTAVGNPTWVPGTTITNGTLANDATRLVDLVRLRGGYSRGFFNTINYTDGVNGSLEDVMVFERTNNVAGNLVVAVNKRQDNGFDVRNVAVNFPNNTRLRELTGNASDPTVDTDNSIPDTVVVSNGRLADAGDASKQYLRIPRNRNSNGTYHGRGYVVYGLAAPSGTLAAVVPGTVTPAATSTIAADAQTGTPPQFWRLRTTPLPVITTGSFELRLDTTKTDALDDNFDNFAVFRINNGYFDYNKNGGVDMPFADGSIDGGYERFLTQFSPISTYVSGGTTVPGTNTVGVYRQVIQTADLVEGNNYVSVIAYRRRTDGGLPVLREFRTVLHVDLLDPQVELVNPNGPITSISYAAEVVSTDSTTQQVWIIANMPNGIDPRTQPGTYLTIATQATRYDRNSWRRTLSGLPSGVNKIDIVAQELSGKTVWKTYSNVVNQVGSGDVNGDGVVTLDDLYDHWALGSTYLAQGDMDRSGTINSTDRRLLEAALRTSAEQANMRGTQR